MKDEKPIPKPPKRKKISRRQFLSTAALTTAGLTAGCVNPSLFPASPGSAISKSPNEKLNIAGIGIGGMGKWNMLELADIEVTKVDGKKTVGENLGNGENVVALCDVDFDLSAETFDLFPKAAKYKDYRKMFDNENIDAVVIATPDHTHAAIAMEAIKRGKHVYLQKPMTYTVKEARIVTEAARKAGVATQMGNQGHSGEGIRLICEWIWDGAIGDVHRVDMWTNRAIWPQGISRPTETPPIPATLDWDKWIGPAPYRAYHPAYLPRFWRGWWDFGTGALGDMGCHIMDPAFWALKLGAPESIEASASERRLAVEGSDWGRRDDAYETFPTAAIVRYKFPARGDMGPMKLNWYDGGLKPPRPDFLEKGRRMGEGGDPGSAGDNGVIFYGDKGALMCGAYGRSPRLIPETDMKAYKKPEKTIERIADSHEKDWVRACKGGPKATSNFEYAGPFTESVLLGNVAIRFAGKKLDWDGKKMKVTNLDEANEFVHRPYREGWSL
ncbi:MAG: Gfo/Idh/MocA family oxidoreductase [Planctomycetes bacterium]|nr:Gfo/Idh/MocA family oxidoreductase [Planctomycetota bacterium]